MSKSYNELDYRRVMEAAKDLLSQYNGVGTNQELTLRELLKKDLDALALNISVNTDMEQFQVFSILEGIAEDYKEDKYPSSSSSYLSNSSSAAYSSSSSRSSSSSSDSSGVVGTLSVTGKQAVSIPLAIVIDKEYHNDLLPLKDVVDFFNLIRNLLLNLKEISPGEFAVVSSDLELGFMKLIQNHLDTVVKALVSRTHLSREAIEKILGEDPIETLKSLGCMVPVRGVEKIYIGIYGKLISPIMNGEAIDPAENAKIVSKIVDEFSKLTTDLKPFSLKLFDNVTAKFKSLYLQKEEGEAGDGVGLRGALEKSSDKISLEENSMISGTVTTSVMETIRVDGSNSSGSSFSSSSSSSGSAADSMESSSNSIPADKPEYVIDSDSAVSLSETRANFIITHCLTHPNITTMVFDYTKLTQGNLQAKIKIFKGILKKAPHIKYVKIINTGSSSVYDKDELLTISQEVQSSYSASKRKAREFDENFDTDAPDSVKKKLTESLTSQPNLLSTANRMFGFEGSSVKQESSGSTSGPSAESFTHSGSNSSIFSGSSSSTDGSSDSDFFVVTGDLTQTAEQSDL